jgi:hypothetical protein
MLVFPMNRSGGISTDPEGVVLNFWNGRESESLSRSEAELKLEEEEDGLVDRGGLYFTVGQIGG